MGRLLISGKVGQIDVTAQRAEPSDVALTDIRVRAEDVVLDTGEASRGRTVVRSIGRGSVQADLGQEEINSRLPKQLRVQLEEGRAVISGPGGAEGQLTVNPQGMIQLRIAGRSVLDLPLPNTSLLPCRPSATFVTGAVRLTCEFTEVPPLLLDLARG